MGFKGLSFRTVNDPSAAEDSTMLMMMFAATAALQYGSCQSGGPDRSRTAAEAARAYVQGLVERNPEPIRWVARPGATWRFSTEAITDAEFYERLKPTEYPNQYPVITGMTGTATEVAIVTRLRGVEGSDRLTVLTVEGGCISNVTVF